MITKVTTVPTEESPIGIYIVKNIDINLNGIYVVSTLDDITTTVIKISNDNDKYTKLEIDAEILILDNEIIDINNDLLAKGIRLNNIDSILTSKTSISAMSNEVLARIQSIKLLKDKLNSDIEYLQSQIDEINIDKYLDPQYVYVDTTLVLNGNLKITVNEYVSYQESDYIRDIDNDVILDSKNNKITINK